MKHPALALAAAALSLGLAGCITLFPKEKPAQLYRFEAAAPAASAAAPTFTVRLGSPDFDEASAGDQILTSNGDQIAYLAGVRWSAPAVQIFDATLAHAFAVAGAPARLVSSASPGAANLRLTLQVTRFEANYGQGMAAPPTVVIRMHATLVREKDMSPVADQLFEANAPATENHADAIVAAYNAATTKAVGDLIAWVDQNGG